MRILKKERLKKVLHMQFFFGHLGAAETSCKHNIDMS